MKLWSKPKVTANERDELAVVQAEAETLRREAVGLLHEARRAGDALKRSRRRNHYGMLLDELFGGGARS